MQWVNTSGVQAVQDDPDFFKKVFCINKKEFNWYPKSQTALTTVKEVPKYERIKEAEAVSTEKKLEAKTEFKDIGQVIICHYPPGNITALETITINASALKAHLDHGDTVGSCFAPTPSPTPIPTTTPTTTPIVTISPSPAASASFSPTPVPTSIPQITPTTSSGQSQFLIKWNCVSCGSIATDASGNVYVTAGGSQNTVGKFTNNGTLITKWGSSGSGDGQFNLPNGVAIDASGNVYVTDRDNNRVQKFTSNGTFITKWGSKGAGNGQFYQPAGIAIDASGNVYVVDRVNNRVQKFTSNGTFITKWGSNGTGNGQFGGSPNSIAIDASGNVYVTEEVNYVGGNRIQKFTNNGTFISVWGSRGTGDGQFYLPRAIAIDANNYVYLTEHDIETYTRVQKFTIDGIFIAKLVSYGTGDSKSITPTGVDTDSSGNIYVVDYNAEYIRVKKFSPGAGVSVSTPTSTTIPTTTTVPVSTSSPQATPISTSTTPSTTASSSATPTPTPAPSSSGSMVISNIQVTNITTNTATVTWTTSQSIVEKDIYFGTTTSYGSSYSVSASGTSHSYNLGKQYNIYTELLPSTTYYFVVKVKGSDGQWSQSSGQSFTTLGTVTDAGNSNVTANRLFVGQYDNVKYSLMVTDPDGIYNFSVKKANGESLFGGGPGVCPSSHQSISSGTVDILSSDFPISGYIIDCASTSTKHTIQASMPPLPTPTPTPTLLVPPTSVMASLGTGKITISWSGGSTPKYAAYKSINGGEYQMWGGFITSANYYDHTYELSQGTTYRYKVWGCDSTAYTCSTAGTESNPVVYSSSTPTPTPTTGSTSFDNFFENSLAGTFTRDLYLGSRGNDVARLQALLVDEVSYPTDLLTGYFGNITREAVKKLQEKYGIKPVSGYFGEITRRALRAFISNQE